MTAGSPRPPRDALLQVANLESELVRREENDLRITARNRHRHGALVVVHDLNGDAACSEGGRKRGLVAADAHVVHRVGVQLPVAHCAGRDDGPSVQDDARVARPLDVVQEM